MRGNVVAGCPHVNLLIDIKAGDDEEHLVDDNDGGDGDGGGGGDVDGGDGDVAHN